MKHPKMTLRDIPPRFLSTLLLFVLAGALLASGPARADLLSKPKPMQGYYFGIALVGNITGVYSSDTGWLSPFFGPGGNFKVGQGLTDHLVLGISFGAAYEINPDYRATLGHFGFELKWRVWNHLFLRPGIGFGFADPTRQRKGLVRIIPAVAGHYSIAFGYDFFVRKRAIGSGGLALTPMAWFSANNGTSLAAVQGGIGFEVTWWTGLPKNQLALPVKDAYR
jgi:hypothetical protein